MKKLIISAIAAVLALTAAACSSLDVVQKDAVRAFGEVLDVYPAFGGDSGDYGLESPDGGAGFNWSAQVMTLWFKTEPFAAAGLDVSKLDAAVYGGGGETTLFFNTGAFNMLNLNDKDTAIEQFAEALKYKRKDLGFHDALGHYNIGFGAGMFEWAKDLNANDKDVVFVLDPAPLIAAGVDPNNVDGWAFAKVTVDIDGKPTEVYKFLKPFDIR